MSASEAKLGDLHELIADELIAVIKNGIVDENGVRHPAPAAYIANAIKLLDASKIEATRDNSKLNKLGSLVSSLPFTSTDEHGLSN
jgi:hypothetical protein